MAKRITTGEEYRTEFGEFRRRERALQYALDIRKFEIELYWKRATYFWTLIAATFGGYFALITRENTRPMLVFLVSCIGLVLSIGGILLIVEASTGKQTGSAMLILLRMRLPARFIKPRSQKNNFHGFECRTAIHIPYQKSIS